MLLLLAFQSSSDNSHALIADGVAAEVELTDGFRALQHTFQLMETLDSNVIFAKSEHFEVSLLPERLAQG